VSGRRAWCVLHGADWRLERPIAPTVRARTREVEANTRCLRVFRVPAVYSLYHPSVPIDSILYLSSRAGIR